MKKTLLLRFLLLATVLPVVVLAALGYRHSRSELTDVAFTRRQEMANLAALALSERFTHLTDIVTTLSSQVPVRELIEVGQWRDGSELLKEMTDDFPFIDRIFLTDAEGIERASSPWVDAVMGVDFSYRDWFRGVSGSGSGKPYVSEVYRRAAEPRENIVAIAAPIKDANGETIAFVVLQVTLDTLLQWSKTIEVVVGNIYFVDQSSHLIGHPAFSAKEDLPSFRSCEIVESIRSEKHGVETLQDCVQGVDVVAAFASVEPFGWGVVFQESVESALGWRNRQLLVILLTSVIIVIVACGAALLNVAIIRRREAAEEAARSAEGFLSTILENIPDTIVVKDAVTKKIVSINRAGEKLLNRKRDELISKGDREIFPPEQAQLIEAKDREAIENGRMTDPLEISVVTPHGKRIVQGKSIPIPGPGGSTKYVLGIIEDVTERRRLDRAKSDFLSLASHQLRTPLSSMRWASEILMEKMGRFSETQQRLVNNIHRAILRMTEIIGSLLTVSRIEASAIRRQVTSIPLPPLFEELRAESQPIAERKHLTLMVECPNALEVKTDRKLLLEILGNLLSNAICYTPEGGNIVLRARTEGVDVLLEVADTGVGIPGDEQDRIFTKLFRASNAAEIDVSGTGLGLYVAHSLADVIGGRLSFVSSVGRGTTFTLHLPADPPLA